MAARAIPIPLTVVKRDGAREFAEALSVPLPLWVSSSTVAMHATTVRFTDDLWELLEREAAAQGVSVAQFVRDAALMRVATVMSRRGDADGDETLARLAAAAASRVSGPPAAVRDPDRLQAVRSSGLLDSPLEERFDRLTRVAAHALSAPVALLSVVEEDRQFVKSSVGLAEPWHSKREMPLSHSFCQHGVGCSALVVADAREHPQLRNSPAIADLGAIAYLGIPLRSVDGYELGAICVIDHRRRDWSADEIAVLRDIADAVEQEIQLEQTRPSSRSAAGSSTTTT